MYTREEIPEKDWERIFTDFERHHDEYKLRQLKNATRGFNTILSWSIDWENDHYLFQGPNYDGSPYTDTLFTFFYKRKIFWIRRYKHEQPENLSFGVWGWIRFDERSVDDVKQLSEDELKELKQAVKDAFRIFGTNMVAEGYTAYSRRMCDVRNYNLCTGR